MSTESNIDEGKGRLKEATGNLTGNKDLEREGKKDQAAASVKDKLGQAKDKAEDMVDSVRDTFDGDKKK